MLVSDGAPIACGARDVRRMLHISDNSGGQYQVKMLFGMPLRPQVSGKGSGSGYRSALDGHGVQRLCGSIGLLAEIISNRLIRPQWPRPIRALRRRAASGRERRRP